MACRLCSWPAVAAIVAALPFPAPVAASQHDRQAAEMCNHSVDADEDLMLMQRNARAGVARRSDAGLHCCDSLGADPPLLLACDATPDDHIVEVPFAVLGQAPEPGTQLYTCGTEGFPGSCNKRVESDPAVRACVGKQTCSLGTGDFESPCPSGELQFRVQWVCQCDKTDCSSGKVSLPPLPLHADGNIIKDASGSRLHIHGVNWAGAHITNAPGGLDRAPLANLARLIRTLGFNVVRLTWSIESVLTNPVVEDRMVAANPSLIGRRALEVLDEVVSALQHEGLLIWLDNHMADTDWCCDRQDCDGFWFNQRWSEDDWVNAWQLLAERYADVPAVVGAGLKNEPHAVCGGRSWGGKGSFCNATELDPEVGAMGCVELEWSTGPQKFQWRRAATRAGHVLLKENPNLLISISGLEYSTDLRLYGEQPAELPRKNLVYEAHEYPWGTYSRWAGKTLSGPIKGHLAAMKEGDAKNLCNSLGGRCSGVTCQQALLDCTVRSGDVLMDSGATNITHRKEFQGDEPYPRFAEKLNTWWGFLLKERIAPVFMSEFGFDQQTDIDSDAWLQHLGAYLTDAGPLADEGGLDWAIWQLGGVQVGGTGRTAGATESFGVLNRCWTGPASNASISFIQSLM